MESNTSKDDNVTKERKYFLAVLQTFQSYRLIIFIIDFSENWFKFKQFPEPSKLHVPHRFLKVIELVAGSLILFTIVIKLFTKVYS